MNISSKQSVAKALLSINAVGFAPHQPITFKSGIVSPVYVDNRQLIYHPAEWHTVITAFREFLETANIAYDVIAGVAVGGVPHSSVVSYLLDKPSVFIRKEAKEHGRGQRIEGGDVANKRVILIEDLVTTGGSSLSGVDALRQSDAIVSDLCGIVSYGFAEAESAFEAAQVNLHTLTDFSTILEVALSQNRFSEADAQIIKDWFTDPHAWAGRYHQA